jgi:hypothetical protein
MVGRLTIKCATRVSGDFFQRQPVAHRSFCRIASGRQRIQLRRGQAKTTTEGHHQRDNVFHGKSEFEKDVE